MGLLCEKIKNTGSFAFQNLVDPKNLDKLSNDSSLLQPIVNSKDHSFEILQFLKVMIDNTSKVLERNLRSLSIKTQYSPDNMDEQTVLMYQDIFKIYFHFQCVVKVLIQEISGENTWSVQKFPSCIVYYFCDALQKIQEMAISKCRELRSLIGIELKSEKKDLDNETKAQKESKEIRKRIRNLFD